MLFNKNTLIFILCIVFIITFDKVFEVQAGEKEVQSCKRIKYILGCVNLDKRSCFHAIFRSRKKFEFDWPNSEDNAGQFFRYLGGHVNQDNILLPSEFCNVDFIRTEHNRTIKNAYEMHLKVANMIKADVNENYYYTKDELDKVKQNIVKHSYNKHEVLLNIVEQATQNIQKKSIAPKKGVFEHCLIAQKNVLRKMFSGRKGDKTESERINDMEVQDDLTKLGSKDNFHYECCIKELAQNNFTDENQKLGNIQKVYYKFIDFDDYALWTYDSISPFVLTYIDHIMTSAYLTAYVADIDTWCEIKHEDDDVLFAV